MVVNSSAINQINNKVSNVMIDRGFVAVFGEIFIPEKERYN